VNTEVAEHKQLDHGELMAGNRTAENSRQPILEVRELVTHFTTRRGMVRAVNAVNFVVQHGEILGLVGESGSGKSVTLLSILRLVPAPGGRIASGEVIFKGDNLLAKSEREMRRIRGRHITMIPQDPSTSLNPVFTIGAQLTESLRLHSGLRGKALTQRAAELLDLVRIPAAATRLNDYPHQMSGGMRQRVVGAIAVACNPELLLADEPTTSLDVTIQAQYLQLLQDLQKQTGMAIVFVTHDLNVVAKICHRVAVMYAGRIVENASARELFANPRHPYTQALMASMPRADRDVERLPAIEGNPPDLHDLPAGCPFAPRCPRKLDRCSTEYPPVSIASPGHEFSCWNSQDAAAYAAR